MAVTTIPNVTNWSVTPQNGQANYFTLMNTWLSESTTVIASLQSSITAQNTANSEINVLAEQTEINAQDAQNARDEAVTALALLSNGAIDDTTIAINKAFSNSYIKSNYYDKTETYNKTEIDEKVTINDFTDKTTPIDTDNIALQESGGFFKKLSWANLKATLLTYFDTLYSRTTSIFGIGQTWQDMTASRSAEVTYTNSTTKPIEILINIGEGTTSTLTINSITLLTSLTTTSGNRLPLSFIVPAGHTYTVTGSIAKWLELR